MKNITKAVIPVAGLGTRLSPITKSIPKEMLPLVDKPILHYIVEEAVKAGIEVIVFVNSNLKGAIQDYFEPKNYYSYKLAEKNKLHLIDEVVELSKKIDFVYAPQKQPLGLGHAVWSAKTVIGENDFSVILGDELFFAPENSLAGIGQCIKAFDELKNTSNNPSVVGSISVPKNEVSKYGVVKFKDKTLDDNEHALVESFVEKPSPQDAPSNWILPGRYVFNKSIFSKIENTKKDKSNEIQLTDAMASLALESDFFVKKMHGKRYDTGNQLNLLKANIMEGLRRPDINKPLRSWLEEYLNNN